MALDPALRGCLIFTINVAKAASYSVGGSRTYAAAVEVKAYVEEVNRRVGTGSGSELDSSHLVITQDAIGIDDRVWLQGEPVTGEGRRPEQVDVLPDVVNGGISHYEVTL